jgi:hypothetical protein
VVGQHRIPDTDPAVGVAGGKVRVNGRPARLTETKSSDCGPEALINGAIEMGPRTFLFMHAEVGARAKPATLAAVRKIFFSAHAS